MGARKKRAWFMVDRLAVENSFSEELLPGGRQSILDSISLGWYRILTDDVIVVDSVERSYSAVVSSLVPAQNRFRQFRIAGFNTPAGPIWEFTGLQGAVRFTGISTTLPRAVFAASMVRASVKPDWDIFALSSVAELRGYATNVRKLQEQHAYHRIVSDKIDEFLKQGWVHLSWGVDEDFSPSYWGRVIPHSLLYKWLTSFRLDPGITSCNNMLQAYGDRYWKTEDRYLYETLVKDCGSLTSKAEIVSKENALDVLRFAKFLRWE